MFRRFACVRQADQSDCGPAALATVALHHRVRVGREKLRDISGTDRVGTTLLGLLKAGERLGFSCRAVKAPYDALRELPLPAIAHSRTAEGFGHYIVIHRVTRNRVVIADPGRGIQHLTRAELEERWTGNLLLLVPVRRLDAAAAGGAPISPLSRFAHLLLTYRPILVEAFVCALLMTALGIGSSYFLQHIVDSVLVRSDRSLLHAFGIAMVMIVVFRTLFSALRQYLLAHVGRQASLALIADYTRHILRLPLRFYEMRRVGEILSRVQDAAKVRDAISGVTLTAVVDGTMVLITLLVLWQYDTRLAAVATGFVPLLLLGVLAHHPAARRRSRLAMEHGAELSAHLNEDVSGVETVKALGQEDLRAEAGESRLVRVVQSGFSLQKLGVSASAAAGLTTGVAGVIVLWYGGLRVLDGALSIGQLMFFNSLLGYLLGPLERLASVNLTIQDALVAVDRLYQVMDLDLEQPPGAGRARLGPLRDAIELRDVAFQYGSRSKVLDKVELVIPAGKTVAIVGESGSGKTTLLKMLMRFHDPTSGQLVFDGVDACDLDTASVRARIALVSQEPFIFTGTLRDNIAMARPGAPLEDIMRAALQAGLGDVIQRLPQRLDTVVGERGANLSGGQRQRLAIARALLAGPDVLIFDEATSHLDTATERAIQETMKTALAGKTVVVVAHRLSTVRDADIIYVLERGTVAERGTHRELVAAGGKYAALVTAQLEGIRDREPPAQPSAAAPQPLPVIASSSSETTDTSLAITIAPPFPAPPPAATAHPSPTRRPSSMKTPSATWPAPATTQAPPMAEPSRLRVVRALRAVTRTMPAVSEPAPPAPAGDAPRLTLVPTPRFVTRVTQAVPAIPAVPSLLPRSTAPLSRAQTAIAAGDGAVVPDEITAVWTAFPEAAMTTERVLELRDVDEFHMTLAARPPAIVHGTALLVIALIGGAIAWASATEASVVVHGASRVRPADAPLKDFDDPSNEQLYAEAGGRVVAIEVKEGQHVAAGDAIVRLDTARLGNEIARLHGSVLAGEAEIAAIEHTVALLDGQRDAAHRRGEAEIERSVHGVSRSRERAVSDQRLARVELDEATRELARARDLVEKQAGPAADVAAARARVDRARERLSASRIGVDDGEPEVLRRSLDQADRDHDVRLADLARQRAAKQGDLAAARAQLANLELDREHATLRAHRAGIVALGGLVVGDVIAAGRLPVAITQDGHLRIDAAIGTADVASLRIGMPVRVKLDALDFQRYGTAGGVISHIAADATVASDLRGVRAYYLVSVALEGDALVRGELRGQLKPGMTGELEAVTERAPLIALLARTLRGAISL